jgi:hypothetical protein
MSLKYATGKPSVTDMTNSGCKAKAHVKSTGWRGEKGKPHRDEWKMPKQVLLTHSSHQVNITAMITFVKANTLVGQ